MTKPNDLQWTSDFSALSKLIVDLLHRKKLNSASYVIGILKTDLAERGHKAIRKKWPIPGEPAPPGWDVYEAALHWCADGYRWSYE